MGKQKRKWMHFVLSPAVILLLVAWMAMTAFAAPDDNQNGSDTIIENGFEDESEFDGWKTIFDILADLEVNVDKHDGEIGISARSGEKSYTLSKDISESFVQYLITPEIDADGALKVELWAKNTEVGEGNEHFKIGYSTGSSDLNDFVWSEDLDVDSGAYSHFEIAAPVGTKYIAVMLDSEYAYGISIDDMSIIGNAAKVTTAPVANDLTADGTEHALVTEGVAEGGTMYYALGEDAETAPEFDGLSEAEDKKWSVAVPVGTESDIYNVWYMAVGDESHSNSKAVCVPVTIKGETIKLVDGKWLYFVDGVHNTEKFGFVNFSGSKFLVANGEVVTTKNGLTQDPDNKSDWYFCVNGQVATQKNGLVQYPAKTDNWFIVENGKLDTTYSGFVDYNNGKFFVAAGKLVRKDGLVQDPNNKADWYFLSKGQVQSKKTGIAKYNGAGFYVVNGKLDSSYNGTVTEKGVKYKVVNGRVAK